MWQPQLTLAATAACPNGEQVDLLDWTLWKLLSLSLAASSACGKQLEFASNRPAIKRN